MKKYKFDSFLKDAGSLRQERYGYRYNKCSYNK